MWSITSVTRSNGPENAAVSKEIILANI